MALAFIDKYEVGASGIASVLFDPIPQIYSDLLILCSARATDVGISIKINNSSSISTKRMQGDGTTGVVDRDGTNSAGFSNWTNSTANIFAHTSIYITDYRSSKDKLYLVEAATENAASSPAYQKIESGIASITAPITSLEIIGSGPFVQFSTISLYGAYSGSDGTTAVS